MLYSIESIILIFFVLIEVMRAHPSGAPKSVCSDLTPKHGVDPQTSDFPYHFHEVLYNQVPKGTDQIYIDIRGTNGTTFKGFVIQARKKSDPDVIVDGTFAPLDNTANSHTIECSPGHQNTLTHSDREEKQTLRIKYLVPKNVGPDIIFLVSIVKDVKTFWVKEKVVIPDSFVPESTTHSHDKNNHESHELDKKVKQNKQNSSSIIALNVLLFICSIILLISF